MKKSRIPSFHGKTKQDLSYWFKCMAGLELLFHPDDPPETIIDLETKKRIFSDLECMKLKEIIKQMFDKFGNETYDAAYPSFMAGIRNLVR